ncbi:MAG: nucleoside 2-deoxyribosyltransferase, partial [Smithellaceae bacterium]|nr:nucleoside 2-deoxyribosyltransferase [Smithellaceae bacterium]
MKTYLSGSFYAPEERQSLEEIAAFLATAGYDVYLPHRDGIEDRFLRLQAAGAFDGEQALLLRKAIFASECYQIIAGRDALLYVMNGRVPEEGSVFKTALAWATGKPLAIYKNDNRSTFHGNDNSMITGLTVRFRTVNAMRKIPGELERAAAVKGNPAGIDLPPRLKEILAAGSAISAFLKSRRLSEAKDEEIVSILKEIAGIYAETEIRTSAADTGKALRKVYLSGPLFCPEELKTMAAIDEVFAKRGYGAYLPQRDGVEAFVMNMVDDPLSNAFIFKPINR